MREAVGTTWGLRDLIRTGRVYFLTFCYLFFLFCIIIDVYLLLFARLAAVCSADTTANGNIAFLLYTHTCQKGARL